MPGQSPDQVSAASKAEAFPAWPAGARGALLDRLARLPEQPIAQRQDALTERLARSLGAPAGGVLLGPSLGALLDLVALAGLEPGQTVAFAEPGALLHPAVALRHRARVTRIDAALGLEPWLALVERDCPRQLWLTLHNPATGAWFAPEALKPLLDAAARAPLPPLVVLEETGTSSPMSHRLSVDAYPNLLLLRSFSGAMTRAGWQLGYALGAPDLIRRLAQAQLPGSVSAPCLEALEVALDYQGAFGAQDRETASPAPQRRLLALDMDGVLVDGDRGFMDAVALALKELAPDLEWQDAHYLAFKQWPGFNNDFRLCAGALALEERGGLGLLWSGLPEDLEARIQALEPTCAECVQRHYLTLPNRDLPLVTRAELDALAWDKAILTGRNPGEAAMGFEVLGFELPGVTDAAPHLRKPSPCGLLQLADAYRAQEIVFAGDTRDDAQTLRLARELRPDLVWRFAAVGAQREFIAREGDLRVPSLRSLLTILQGDRP